MQRSIAAVLSLLFALPLTALAQHDHSAMMAQASTTTAPAKAPATTAGVVKRIDRPARTMTIAHEPLANLGMPRMTMTFKLKDPALLDGVKEGSKIQFVAENLAGELTVVALKVEK